MDIPLKPWELTVKTKSPVVGLYEAPVGVNEVLAELEGSTVIVLSLNVNRLAIAFLAKSAPL